MSDFDDRNEDSLDNSFGCDDVVISESDDSCTAEAPARVRRANVGDLLWATVVLAISVPVVIKANDATGGWAIVATAFLPLSIGIIIGACRGELWTEVGASVLIMGVICASVYCVGCAGLFCILTGFLVFMIPVWIGVCVASFFRNRSDRPPSPWLWLLPFLTIPAHMIEQRFLGDDPRVVHRTEQVVAATPERVWAALRYYDELTHEPPFALRIGFPRPVSTTGVLGRVGDEQHCVYTKGFVDKRLTECDRIQRVSFDVIDQHTGFARSLWLVRGSFELRPTGDGQTRLIVETEYVAHLRPRFVWSPFESWALGSLHEYLIEGVRLELDRSASASRVLTQSSHSGPPRAPETARASSLSR